MTALNQLPAVSCAVIAAAGATGVLAHMAAFREKVKSDPSILVFDAFKYASFGCWWTMLTALILVIEPRVLYDDYAQASLAGIFDMLGWMIALGLFFLGRREEFYGTHALQKDLQKRQQCKGEVHG